MLTSPRLSYVVGAVTAWVPVYIVGFVASVLVAVVSSATGGGAAAPFPAFGLMVVLHLLTMLVTFALLAVYLVDVFRNPDLVGRQDARTMWVLLVILLGAFGMVAYWWRFLRPGGESFRRRRAALQPA